MLGFEGSEDIPGKPKSRRRSREKTMFPKKLKVGMGWTGWDRARSFKNKIDPFWNLNRSLSFLLGRYLLVTVSGESSAWRGPDMYQNYNTLALLLSQPEHGI